VPAVTTAVRWHTDVVTPATGVLVRPGDFAGMGEALPQLAGDRSRRRQLRAHATSRSTGKFSAERLLEDIDALYSKLLDEPREARMAAGRGAER
jgi:glycosyltransferase involved in cell wall biosynthesis